MGDFEYKAFISYSHRDTAWARWLLTALETYRMPANLPSPLGALPKRGVGKIFRDRDEAGAAGDLKDEIQRALATSEQWSLSPHPIRRDQNLCRRRSRLSPRPTRAARCRGASLH
jgi:hypothetical protein